MPDLPPLEEFEEQENQIESVEKIDEDGYLPMTFDDKWEDFKSRSKYKDMTDLVHQAQDLYDQVPPKAMDKKIKLSFFLSQAYKKKGNMDKAREYSEAFMKFSKTMMGGRNFQGHNNFRNDLKEFKARWKEEGVLE